MWKRSLLVTNSDIGPLTLLLASARWVSASLGSLLWFSGPQFGCFCSLSLLPSALVLGAAGSCFQLKNSNAHYSRADPNSKQTSVTTR